MEISDLTGKKINWAGKKKLKKIKRIKKIGKLTKLLSECENNVVCVIDLKGITFFINEGDEENQNVVYECGKNFGFKEISSVIIENADIEKFNNDAAKLLTWLNRI